MYITGMLAQESPPRTRCLEGVPGITLNHKVRVGIRAARLLHDPIWQTVTVDIYKINSIGCLTTFTITISNRPFPDMRPIRLIQIVNTRPTGRLVECKLLFLVG